MAEEFKEDKTEPATPFRRQEARKKGQVARSQDVGSAAVFLTGILVLWATGPMIVDGFVALFRETLGHVNRPDLDCASAAQIVTNSCFRAFLPVAPTLVAMAAVGALAGFAQVGFYASSESFGLNLDKFDPVNGVKRLFSLRSTVMLGTSLLKIVAVLIVGYITVRGYMPKLLGLAQSSPHGIAQTMVYATLDLCVRMGLVLLIIAAIDYAYQRWQHERDLRMSKQDLRDEMKTTEGNPEIQSRIRRAQVALSRTRMLGDVKKADVIVRNPTHFAVALKYDPEKAAAPIVLAKGADLLAKRIIELALKHKIPMVHEPPLAQALYKSVEVGETIPPKLFRAVARILVQIYKLRGKRIPGGSGK